MSKQRQRNRTLFDQSQLIGGVLGIVIATLTARPVFVGFFFLALVSGLTLHRRSAYVTGWLAARQLELSILSTGLCYLSAAAILYLNWQGLGDLSLLGTEVTATDLAVFSALVVALIAGVFLRQAVEQLSFFTLTGYFASHWDLILLGIWSLTLLIFPWTAAPVVQAAFLVGLGTGIILHKSVRLRVARTAAGYRRIELILDIWPTADWTPGEKDALELLRKGRRLFAKDFKELRNYLDDLRNKSETDPSCWTKITALISATAFRLEGRFNLAIRETYIADEKTLAQSVDAHLLLLRIICLYEINDVDRADAVIQQLRASEHRKHCPLTSLLYAERLAHKTLENPRATVPGCKALRAALRAMELRRTVILERTADPAYRTRKAYLAKFIEVSVPSTATIMTNIVGLSHLAAGHPDQARKHFSQCIAADPMMSSAYLNLGEYFLFRSLFWGSKPSRSDLQSAEAAYRAAGWVEGVKESRIHIMVQKRLSLLKGIRKGEDDAIEPLAAEPTAPGSEVQSPDSGKGNGSASGNGQNHEGRTADLGHDTSPEEPAAPGGNDPIPVGVPGPPGAGREQPPDRPGPELSLARGESPRSRADPHRGLLTLDLRGRAGPTRRLQIPADVDEVGDHRQPGDHHGAEKPGIWNAADRSIPGCGWTAPAARSNAFVELRLRPAGPAQDHPRQHPVDQSRHDDRPHQDQQDEQQRMVPEQGLGAVGELFEVLPHDRREAEPDRG